MQLFFRLVPTQAACKSNVAADLWMISWDRSNNSSSRARWHAGAADLSSLRLSLRGNHLVALAHGDVKASFPTVESPLFDCSTHKDRKRNRRGSEKTRPRNTQRASDLPCTSTFHFTSIYTTTWPEIQLASHAPTRPSTMATTARTGQTLSATKSMERYKVQEYERWLRL